MTAALNFNPNPGGASAFISLPCEPNQISPLWPPFCPQQIMGVLGNCKRSVREQFYWADMPALNSDKWLNRLRTFWPLVLGISPHQFASYLRIQSLPEPRQICRGLHGSLIRREQVHYQRSAMRPDARRVSHAEKVLKARRYPWGFAAAVMNFCRMPVLQANTYWSKFSQKLRVHFLL